MELSLMYPSINTKLKAMYSKKLTLEDFSELSKQPDSEKALLFLKSKKDEFKFLSENADRIEIETQLDKNLIKDIQKIEGLLNKNSKYYLKLFLSKYEIRCIKSVFRKIYSRSILNEDLSNVEIWTEIIFKEIRGLNNVTSFEEFLTLIKKTPYYQIFKKYEDSNIKEINIFEVENKLDIMYFKKMIEIAETKRNPILKDIIGSQIDLENIAWIYRTKKFYKFNEEEIWNTIIKYFYKISKDEIKLLINSSDYEEFENILQKTVYKKLVTGNEENLEQMISKILYDKNKKIFKNNMFNINFIYSYINIVDLENNDITNIIEGIRYNLSRTDILKKLVVNII